MSRSVYEIPIIAHEFIVDLSSQSASAGQCHNDVTQHFRTLLAHSHRIPHGLLRSSRFCRDMPPGPRRGLFRRIPQRIEARQFPALVIAMIRRQDGQDGQGQIRMVRVCGAFSLSPQKTTSPLPGFSPGAFARPPYLNWHRSRNSAMACSSTRSPAPRICRVASVPVHRTVGWVGYLRSERHRTKSSSMRQRAYWFGRRNRQLRSGSAPAIGSCAIAAFRRDDLCGGKIVYLAPDEGTQLRSMRYRLLACVRRTVNHE